MTREGISRRSLLVGGGAGVGLVIAFATQNRDRQGNYFDGLATTVPTTCRAADDLAFPLGDSREGSVRAALDFLAGRNCNPITAEATQRTASTDRSAVAGRREVLTPDRPSAPQREVPGLF